MRSLVSQLVTSHTQPHRVTNPQLWYTDSISYFGRYFDAFPKTRSGFHEMRSITFGLLAYLSLTWASMPREVVSTLLYYVIKYFDQKMLRNCWFYLWSPLAPLPWLISTFLIRWQICRLLNYHTTAELMSSASHVGKLLSFGLHQWTVAFYSLQHAVRDMADLECCEITGYKMRLS